MSNKWKFLIGDVNWQDYGGTWYRHVANRHYHVVELINLRDAMGEEAEVTYSVSLKSVNLDEVPRARLDAAIMGDWDGDAYRPLIVAAKRESNRLISDKKYVESQMSRPVNRLGSTAREFASGDMQSALVRGIAKGDKIARIIGKVHGMRVEDIDSIGPEYADFTLDPNG